ncbi:MULTISPECIES: aldolase/citrate lyase family protein [Microbacterium]|jgi:2-keto-3-deoxy-L-rhamnonate aldolase RhmA|uniref:HpcH/HpaI aldolase family protein n=1 Tax=Microbacterium TaxID=33882 RepID=UPI0023DBA1AF|nr:MULTISPECIES: aldolase/citrate lyase family protein [Microbacterium]MDF2046456.1 aldolase/citrate lyase family protein [Microbacterium sp. Kw_RZR3]MDF2506769.1 2,4-dihydroxyhept-2-ene,7-dioic acid aldolase [Microbacterium sp.]MDQ1075877.1 2-keto-3-deoxy-L-rhamnonate aldolase RhmA [Microbacterium sp. SORGH_AS_0969]MDQ1116122.1 2-keto-3-deoxy-L-rhamnonate aldolase RhmA [Microbacterium testaceum]
MTRLYARAEFERLIRNGHTPAGVFVMSTDAAITALYGDAGYDWVLIDREHGIMDNSHLRAHLMAAEANGIVPIVRVLENNHAAIQQTLDAGAQGVMVPKIESADGAARAVKASRYQAGGRGMCPVVPATNFSGDDWAPYAARMNNNALIIPLIETKAGVDHIEEICAVEGVDYVFFGLADLSQDLGIDMVDDIDQLIALWEQVVRAAHSVGVRVGAPLGYGFDDLADYGSLASDLSTLRAAAERDLAGLRQAATPTAP